jgi:hypothetical protein
MKKTLVVLMVLLLVPVGIIAVSTAGESMPGADAQSLWKYITQTNPYQKWETWPGHPDMYPGQSPHGAFLRLYANPVAIEAAKAGKIEMPDGALIVKENYGKDQKTLMAVTPMYKIEGYNPDAGDWYWAKYGADGSVEAAGKPEGCIRCHSVKKQNDWIFTEVK